MRALSRRDVAVPRSYNRVRALDLNVTIDEGLREVGFGVQEGQPMSEWFTDWVAGKATPEGAESFPILRRRAVAAVNRAVVQPPLVLVVAHGALFRALRASMRIEPNIRTRNAVPIWCTPPAAEGASWSIAYIDQSAHPAVPPPG